MKKCAKLILILSAVLHIARAGEEELEALIFRLNSDVIELRNEVESSIATRCDSIRGCLKSSYDECQSAYTELQSCPSESELGIVFTVCGAGSRCNGLIDYSVSTVRIPENLAQGPDRNPTNPAVIEDVCMTLPTQRWMVKKYWEEKTFWSSLGVARPQMYFGSDTGVFRIYPARQSEECGKYDPRTRPWYQAALPSTISNAVKPRRVIIMLDTSRSMGEKLNARSEQTKLSYMKQSVIAVLNTLSPNDSIAVIRFAEIPRLVNRPSQVPPYLWEKASKATVANIIDIVNALEVNGRSNWNDAFGFAFNLINNSLESNAAIGDESYCDLENIAVLFFSDGEYNLPAGATDESVVSFVSAKVTETENMGDNHVHMFLYTLGHNDPSGVEKKISCAVDGYWKPVLQGTSPVNVTNGYQTLFSTPLGTDAFYNYTTWSNPYNFTSGRLGYTVSSLVYDRNVEPPRFEGAVGMDVSVDAAIRVFNGTLLETEDAIKRITRDITVQNYNTTCDQQRINLTKCEIQSIRHYAGGNAAVCIPEKTQTVSTTPAMLPVNATTNITVAPEVDGETDGLTDFISEEAADFFEDALNCSKAFVQPCPGYEEYPTNLWRNVEMKDLTYQDRVCCEVGTNEPSDDCPKLDEVASTKISKTAIFGILFASLVVVEIVGCYFCFYVRKQRANT
mmetsp:Transcript_1326/g.2174  ORF Transcript_1326/g.2174 Transcript_1326/m.2174 type:complete len:678 (+) Transcript_1326:203-2236(+)